MKTTIALLILVATTLSACGTENMKACTIMYGPTVAVSNAQNNSQCPIGQSQVGYDEGAIGGPLLCSTLTVTCPDDE